MLQFDEGRHHPRVHPETVETDPLPSPSPLESFHITDGLCERCHQPDFETAITEDVFERFVDEQGDRYGRQPPPKLNEYWKLPANAVTLQKPSKYESILMDPLARLVRHFLMTLLVQMESGPFFLLELLSQA